MQFQNQTLKTYTKKRIRIKEAQETGNFKGCRFKARCLYAIEKCSVEPELQKVNQEHYSACYVKLD